MGCRHHRRVGLHQRRLCLHRDQQRLRGRAAGLAQSFGGAITFVRVDLPRGLGWTSAPTITVSVLGIGAGSGGAVDAQFLRPDERQRLRVDQRLLCPRVASRERATHWLIASIGQSAAIRSRSARWNDCALLDRHCDQRRDVKERAPFVIGRARFGDRRADVAAAAMASTTCG